MNNFKGEKMETIGELLKRVREEKNISIEEIVKVTKIRQTYIKAIEENNKLILPGEAYYKTFLKSYAICLGLDYEDIRKKYLTEEPLEKKSGRKPEADEINQIEIKNQIKITTIFDRIFSKGINFKNILIAAGIILFIYFILSRSSSKSSNVEEKPSVQEEIHKEENKISETNTQINDTSSLKETSHPQSSAAKPKREEFFSLQITGIETTWVRVKVDNEDVYEVFVKPAETRDWKARQKFELKVGNAGGIKVKLNDKDIPPIGKRGEVLDNVVFSRDKKNKD
ncbi:MAG: DUF4115 domain-containing protein [Candidatus Firestonebacteria bacterium]|nr:DUF4115 domain-containing protein [Candidatus Firestonebacteria bacterium]